ncbi:MAG TPA: hypothetical protein ENJ82_11165 [Bacteroidetes bacterium]|nr:hypothetical protein [Bacteroidota bacterium]
MQRQVFIGYMPDDKRYINKIMKWASQEKLGDRVVVTPLNDDSFYDEYGDLKRDQLSWALKEAALVLILIGEENWDHPWLDWEGEFCHQWGIKRVIIRIPYTDGDLPEPFTVLREIAYNPNAVEKELRSTIDNSYY